MSKFPIIFGIIDKKLYLIILLALTRILYEILKYQIPEGHNISLINSLGGSIVKMLSIFIPIIFKFKGKFEISKIKCTKIIFKDYLILLIIILSYFGMNKFIEYLDIKAVSVSEMWIGSFFLIISYFVLSIKILKAKYYIHNIISLILCCTLSVAIDLILETLQSIELASFLDVLPIFVQGLLFCYIKYLIDIKYHSYWNILFFSGLYYFIIYLIEFIIIIIKEPYDNSIFKAVRKAETKYIILNFFLDIILKDYLKELLELLIVQYFSYNHVLISIDLYLIVNYSVYFISNKYEKRLFFLIPAFFQILSLLFYLEIMEFNFCNLNRNTKRNIMIRQEKETFLDNNSNASDIEIDNDLIIKNPQEKTDSELNETIDAPEGKDNGNEK